MKATKRITSYMTHDEYNSIVDAYKRYIESYNWDESMSPKSLTSFCGDALLKGVIE